MHNADFTQAAPDIDYADPETDTLCHYCGSVEDPDEDECVVCFPRCLVEDSPIRLSVRL